ncbi:MAG: DUF2842 domain-containing protein [Sphingomonadaceae bacterium]|uniref:DUF2842 domain-containing protein n=1 Tax=Thermaurantiacus sp. TaxID=2820283 RepID=UPI00298F3920|nr:DUF2842 domain-containing protein [Thermaurantiacus sp.]MCS6986657.1 DUF2842 domain-containing protein [Sphingomonadaceae bacterium]MDW8414081.1 DUF2842 domain-containing protein [Thermaurantiacus sp.]
MTPHLRRPLSVLALVLFLAAYAAIVVGVFAPVARLPALAQAPIWAVLGIAWVWPVRPFLRWIETGRWRP